jgi:hypothetical protein
VIANGISDEAVASYAASGFTDEAYAASVKSLDEAMASPDLALSRSERSALMGSARTALNAQRSEIRAAERELEAKIRAAQSEALSQFSIDISDARLRAGEGYAPGPDELASLARLAGQTRNPEKYLAQVAQLGLMGQVQQEFRSLSIPDQDRYLQQLELAAAQGSAEAARQLDPARKVAASARKAAESDPATYSALREKRLLTRQLTVLAESQGLPLATGAPSPAARQRVQFGGLVANA